MTSPAEKIRRTGLIFDGGTGTFLQAHGLRGGELPETWNLTRPDVIVSLHRAYLDAGAEVFNTNTFGANRLHFPEGPEAVVRAAVRLAKQARREAGRENSAWIALDIGPSGKLLKPFGDLAFEDAVSLFAETVRAGADEGADLILIETMSDLYEAKAAVLAAKENCSLPVFLTCTFDTSGKLLTGADVPTVVAVMEGLGVDALGINCSLGPREMLPIVRELLACASVPVIVVPNAGLPAVTGGKTVYAVGPEEFVSVMQDIAALGAAGLGGCCGTDPEYIRQLSAALRGGASSPENGPKAGPGAESAGGPGNSLPRGRITALLTADPARVTSWSHTRSIGGDAALTIIGERINPTGKKRFRRALAEHDLDYILDQALEQEAAGAHLLDVNVGTPEIDEAAMMAELIPAIQAVTDLPLVIDTSDPKALETALRAYNGKALVNSVSGKKESLQTVLPLLRKYGGAVIALCLDEQGIPATADGRLAVARKILSAAASYGIPKEDLLFDALTMAVSAQPDAALVTLETVRRLRDELGVHTVLGVSNVSFGLPNRVLLNAQFLTMARQNGLSAAILNPNDGFMTDAVRSADALLGHDAHFAAFTEVYKDLRSVGARDAARLVPAQLGSTGAPSAPLPEAKAAPAAFTAAGRFAPLCEAISRGLTGPAASETRALLAAGEDPFAVITEALVPALDTVGRGFEKGSVFLPQLLISADAAKAAFSVIRESLPADGQPQKGPVILATVQGDIHDIGKNIVKVMLENYGYAVIDLGKDVPPAQIVQTALEKNIRLVGLSALMTTTVGAMEETIRQLRKIKPDTRIVVGGAVMTESYAARIGADAYARDAMATVRYADRVFAEDEA
ncbi:MAG: homocysteine S-methyltransferase family protein [Lachnospiraceae bacterium]|nr:homocysteine S-methyltransferase family protein [Lachnospiraceae bacterium]